MQTRLIHALARQHPAELHEKASARRLANAADREHDNIRAVISTARFGRLGRFRARLASQTTRTEPAAHERRAEAFPLWQAAKARLARVEAGVHAVEETIEAGVHAVEETIEAGVEAVEETIERVSDKTPDLVTSTGV
jgi:hypothetical protein